ncbi:hypothetical protein PROH_05000 [Prochlorothrix hollandica PCC 9006 = CALU 1027]|uniref:Uncharacterized protein n=1 Tax=Prochlorothrix hollandica PCC 9006 = CALU 1027 TaxID=317619 RepID=A0A0M2Q120_PROHO|nr:hypothetical protein PROH_05000 [Prochlorothrix hollandica PCC 9006 = CALU 1027]
MVERAIGKNLKGVQQGYQLKLGQCAPRPTIPLILSRLGRSVVSNKQRKPRLNPFEDPFEDPFENLFENPKATLPRGSLCGVRGVWMAKPAAKPRGRALG